MCTSLISKRLGKVLFKQILKMSDACGKKKPQKNSQDWEEAGSEFYQESYNAESDVVQNSSYAITTFLPSKQCRIGTTRKPKKKDNSKTNFWKTVSSTSQKKGIPIENNLAQIPDLSEVLTDEEHIWQQMLEIKLLAIPMNQKKEIKINLQKATKLRLQGFNQFKWKHRKILLKVKINFAKACSYLMLWKSSLKVIEGIYGTGIMAYFLFIRWLFLLNCVTFIIIFFFLIFPTYIQQNCRNDFEFDPIECGNTSKFYSVITSLKNFKNWNCSLLLYGFYKSKSFHTADVNLEKIESIYDVSLAYLFVPLVTYTITLLAIVRGAANEFRDQLLYRKFKFVPFSCILFTCWEFCIRNRNASRLKQKAISNEILNLLVSKRLHLKRCHRLKNNFWEIILIRCLVNILIFGVLAISAFILYIIFNKTLKQEYVSAYNFTQNVNSCVEASAEYSASRTVLQLDWLKIFGKNINEMLEYFCPYIVMVSLNFVLPHIFSILCQFERYSPVFSVKINLYRTILVRFSSLAIFVLRIYEIANHENLSTNQGSRCWENYVGELFYMLAITEFVTLVFVTFCINFPRYFLVRNMNNYFAKLIGHQDFQLAKHTLDIVYLQTLCWLGTFYSPFLPCLTGLSLLFLFYVKKFQCLVNSKPSEVVYGFTKSNALFMLILIISYFCAITPLVYAVTEIRTSNSCGPFNHQYYVKQQFTQTFISLPYPVKQAFIFAATAKFVIPMFFILLLMVYYFYVVSDANKQMVEVLRNQLVLEGHDKQFLLARLSYFFKYQKDNPH